MTADVTGSPAASAPALAPETGTTDTKSLGAKTGETDPTAATAAPRRGPKPRTRAGSDEDDPDYHLLKQGVESMRWMSPLKSKGNICIS